MRVFTVVVLFYLPSLGTCIDMVNNYICQCQPGYTGFNCSFEIDECQSSPCINGNNTDAIINNPLANKTGLNPSPGHEQVTYMCNFV